MANVGGVENNVEGRIRRQSEMVVTVDKCSRSSREALRWAIDHLVAPGERITTSLPLPAYGNNELEIRLLIFLKDSALTTASSLSTKALDYMAKHATGNNTEACPNFKRYNYMAKHATGNNTKACPNFKRYSLEVCPSSCDILRA